MKMLIFLCIIGFLLLGCDNKIDREELDTARLEKYYLKKVERSGEIIALLSAKYKIEGVKVKEVLAKYLIAHGYYYTEYLKTRAGKDKTENKVQDGIFLDLEDALIRLTNKYKIPKYKLASLIIDYRIWDK